MSVLDQLRQDVIDYATTLVREAADITVTETQADASERTGALREGISHDEPTYAEPYVSCTIISTADYSEFQDEGTGIYGPTGERITPTKPGGVLVFDWPAAGGVVFARSVAGSPGRHFFREPMPERWANAVQAAG